MIKNRQFTGVARKYDLNDPTDAYDKFKAHMQWVDDRFIVDYSDPITSRHFDLRKLIVPFILLAMLWGILLGVAVAAPPCDESKGYKEVFGDCYAMNRARTMEDEWTTPALPGFPDHTLSDDSGQGAALPPATTPDP